MKNLKNMTHPWQNFTVINDQYEKIFKIHYCRVSQWDFQEFSFIFTKNLFNFCFTSSGIKASFTKWQQQCDFPWMRVRAQLKVAADWVWVLAVECRGCSWASVGLRYPRIGYPKRNRYFCKESELEIWKKSIPGTESESAQYPKGTWRFLKYDWISIITLFLVKLANW